MRGDVFDRIFCSSLILYDVVDFLLSCIDSAQTIGCAERHLPLAYSRSRVASLAHACLQEGLIGCQNTMSPVNAVPIRITKRDGSRVEVDVMRIQRHVQSLCVDLSQEWIDPTAISHKIMRGLCDGMTTEQIDTHAAEVCAYQAQRHPDFAMLAARLAVKRLHKNTSDSFVETCHLLREHRDAHGRFAPLLGQDFWNFVSSHSKTLDDAIDYARDFEYDYFGLRTLERTYLMSINGRVVERPQHLLMRVACAIHVGDLAAALETYDFTSRRLLTQASPTLFNAGTLAPQMSSCFLLRPRGESIGGIFEILRQCALISSAGGGIGVDIGSLCSSYGSGSNSKGLVPVLRVFNEAARLADQGCGKRKGAFAIYVEPWHADIFEILNLRKNHGPEEGRTRDLFYGLWVPDLFMRRVEADSNWSLFCPSDAREGLQKDGPCLADLCVCVCVWSNSMRYMKSWSHSRVAPRGQLKLDSSGSVYWRHKSKQVCLICFTKMQ